MRSASAKCGEPADLIAEFDDKGKALTVQSTGLTDGDTIYFEEGEPPKSGMMYFSVYLWRCNTPVDTMEPCSHSPAAEADDAHDSEVLEEVSSYQQQFQALETSKKSHLSLVGEVSCIEDDNLSRLQELVFVQLCTLPAESFDDGLLFFIISYERKRYDLILLHCTLLC